MHQDIEGARPRRHQSPDFQISTRCGCLPRLAPAFRFRTILRHFAASELEGIYAWISLGAVLPPPGVARADKSDSISVSFPGSSEGRLGGHRFRIKDDRSAKQVPRPRSAQRTGPEHAPRLRRCAQPRRDKPGNRALFEFPKSLSRRNSCDVAARETSPSPAPRPFPRPVVPARRSRDTK